jgi:hypothetical protein
MAMSNIRSKKRGSSILLCTEDWKRAKLELDIFTNDSGIRLSFFTLRIKLAGMKTCPTCLHTAPNDLDMETHNFMGVSMFVLILSVIWDSVRVIESGFLE